MATVGISCSLPLQEQLFMTLVRLRLGLLEHDLAFRFNISQATVSINVPQFQVN